MTCAHVHRTLLLGEVRGDGITYREWHCEDCGEMVLERVAVPERLYTCNGDCADCPEWKEEPTCNSTSA